VVTVGQVHRHLFNHESERRGETFGVTVGQVHRHLFNHESERRGETFVTRKITLAAARISQVTHHMNVR